MIAALLAMRLPPPKPRKQRESVLAELREGFQYVWNFAPIAPCCCPDGADQPHRDSVLHRADAGVCNGPDSARYTRFRNARLSDGLFRRRRTCRRDLPAIRRSVVGLGRVIAIAAAVFGASLIAFSFSHHLWLSLMIVPIGGSRC